MASPRRNVSILPQNLDAKVVSTPLDTDGNLRLLQQLDRRFQSVRCREPTCGADLSILGAMDHLMTWMPFARGSQPMPLSALLCKKCRKYTCVGCGEKPVTGSQSVTVDKKSGIMVSTCCENGKLFGAWILLSAFDEIELSVQGQKTQHPQSRSRPSAGKGTGNGRDDPLDFGASRQWGGEAPIQKYKGNDGKDDQPIRDILKILPLFLPSPKSKPAPALVAMLRLSFLLDRLATLIANDSITNMTQRKDLYHAVYAFLTVVANHPVLVEILLEQRPSKKQSPGLQALGGEANRRLLKVDTSSAGLALSLATCVHRAVPHAKAFANLSKQFAIEEDVKSEDNKEAVNLCIELLSFYGALKKTGPVAMDRLAPTIKDEWKIYAERNRVTFTDDVLQGPHTVLEGHRFQKGLRGGLSATDSAPGRMKRLWKELADLSTSLPFGIFLKVSETRLDVMKAIISGVPGSPYEGGLFAFDIYLPPWWPTLPPQLNFAMDVGEFGANIFSDSYAPLNPNIHPGGQLCLSLLNMWPGNPEEMWQVNVSTLLSVFVSIQSMIFGEPYPYRNERGRERTGGSHEAKDYNKKVQCKTVLYAMIFWLENDDAKRGIWKDIIATYWRHNGKRVLDVVKKWSKKNELLRAYGGSRGVDLVSRLEKGLVSFNAGLSGQGAPRYMY